MVNRSIRALAPSARTATIAPTIERVPPEPSTTAEIKTGPSEPQGWWRSVTIAPLLTTTGWTSLDPPQLGVGLAVEAGERLRLGVVASATGLLCCAQSSATAESKTTEALIGARGTWRVIATPGWAIDAVLTTGPVVVTGTAHARTPQAAGEDVGYSFVDWIAQAGVGLWLPLTGRLAFAVRAGAEVRSGQFELRAPESGTPVRSWLASPWIEAAVPVSIF
jgi:hypothetical protein